jgi:AcrR family transcriptional regulator
MPTDFTSDSEFGCARYRTLAVNSSRNKEPTVAASAQAMPDRRVTRTLLALRAGLIGLMVEKDWDDISVQDICDRANIGRSTFYTHYNDKGDLLLAGFEELRRELRARRAKLASSDRLAFARGIIDHAYEHRDLFRALFGKRSGHLVQKRFRKIVTDLVKLDFADLIDDRARVDAIAHYVAGAFLELITWWLDTRNSLEPDDIETLFRKMTTPAIAGAQATSD